MNQDDNNTHSNYIPKFTWYEQKGADYKIFDGNDEIASFYPGTNQLPDNDRKALRPISLHNLRLTPKGAVMIEDGETCGPLCLSWRKHLIYNMEIMDLDVDSRDSTCLRIYLKTQDTDLRKDQKGLSDYKPNNFIEETWLEVKFDQDKFSYVYDVRTQLKVRPGRERFVIDHDLCGLEFGDILPAGADDYFPPRGAKKYSYIVYKNMEGEICNRPQNKHLGPDKMDIFYAPDGFIAFVSEKKGNPVIEFLDGTGAMARSQICWAMYDVHLKYIREKQIENIRKNSPLEMHYKLYSIPFDNAERLLKHSRPDPVLEHVQARCPVFVENALNEFKPSYEYRQPSDNWTWQCNDTNCCWLWEKGYHSDGVLFINRNSAICEASPEETPWTRMFDYSTNGNARSQWEYPKLSGKCGYKIFARVRTENVVGKALLALQYCNPDVKKLQNIKKCSDVIFSELSLNGSNDWTQLVLETPSHLEKNYRNAALFLVLEGKGKCWFDEVEVIPVNEM